MEEEWRPIPNYIGYYEVSNIGNVRSVDRLVTYSNGVQRVHKGKILKQDINYKGYHRVRLQKDGKSKSFSVHRLVALAFIPNPNSLPQVNHIDENKSNNCVSNLEWCTSEYNNNYGNHINNSVTSYKNNNDLGRHVLRCDMDNNIIQEYRSTYEVQKLFGKNHSYIKKCCDNNKIAYGYRWRWGVNSGD